MRRWFRWLALVTTPLFNELKTVPHTGWFSDSP